MRQFPFSLCSAIQLAAMKSKALKEKYKSKLCFEFVKPLYKKVRDNNSFTATRGNLVGNGICVKRDIVAEDVVVKSVVFKHSNGNSLTLPGQSADEVKTVTSDAGRSLIDVKDRSYNEKRSMSVLGLLGSAKNGYQEPAENMDRIVQISNADIVYKAPDSWLRWLPARRAAGEGWRSSLVRCLLCQLGLVIALLLTTAVFTFIVHSAEAPYERQVSDEFERMQYQLVIDLATELRQITPTSPAWLLAVERRVEDARHLAERMSGRGARHKPGHFWSLSGTFLFAVYVCTALGFGAPVPQTLFGRIAALLYAGIAIPTHVFLMVNASTCIVVNVEIFVRNMKKQQHEKLKVTLQSSSEVFQEKSTSPSTNSDQKTKSKVSTCLRNIPMNCFTLLWLGHGVPIASVFYYALGAVVFGVSRGKGTFQTFAFTLEFTTNGGLENVEGLTRVMYGLYVEGAMLLVACALCIIRRSSHASMRRLADRYRLYVETTVW